MQSERPKANQEKRFALDGQNCYWNAIRTKKLWDAHFKNHAKCNMFWQLTTASRQLAGGCVWKTLSPSARVISSRLFFVLQDPPAEVCVQIRLDTSGSGPPYGHWTRAGRLQRCFLALEVGPCAELVPHSAWNWVTWSQTSRLSSPPVAHQADYLSGFVKVLSSCQRQGKRIWDHVGTNWTFFVLFSPVAHAVHRHASGYSGARCHPSGAVFHLWAGFMKLATPNEKWSIS